MLFGILHISTHSLTRRLTRCSWAVLHNNIHFNSQPHKEADWITGLISMFLNHFNSQPHKEADMYSAKRVSPITAFQLTASQGGWREISCVLDGWLYFNSQPHKEADGDHCDCVNVFCKFQLTASQGGWRFPQVPSWRPMIISTHSLTRRLTSQTCHEIIEESFQLTASQGGWRDYRRNGLMACAFQLTASQGGWLRRKSNLSQERDFNSQPHKEADCNEGYAGVTWSISTHSLTRRLTWYVRLPWLSDWNFNSQPHKEADEG